MVLVHEMLENILTLENKDTRHIKSRSEIVFHIYVNLYK